MNCPYGHELAYAMNCTIVHELPTELKKQGNSIHDDLSVNSFSSAVLFTFVENYGIIQLVHKLELER